MLEHKKMPRRALPPPSRAFSLRLYRHREHRIHRTHVFSYTIPSILMHHGVCLRCRCRCLQMRTPSMLSMRRVSWCVHTGSLAPHTYNFRGVLIKRAETDRPNDRPTRQAHTFSTTTTSVACALVPLADNIEPTTYTYTHVCQRSTTIGQ